MNILSFDEVIKYSKEIKEEREIDLLEEDLTLKEELLDIDYFEGEENVY